MTQLKLQVRDAAEREARRGPFRRGAAGLRANGPRPLLAGATLVVLAVAVVLIEGQLSHKAPAPPAHQPALRVVARVPLTTGGGALALGSGALWAADPATGDLLRVAPDTGRVLARIHTGVKPQSIAVGAGAVWVYDTSGRLLRVDPAAGRVTASLALGLDPHMVTWYPSNTAVGGVAVLDGRVWASDRLRAVRIDPTGRSIDRRVTIGANGMSAPSMAVDGRDFIVLGEDGKVTTYDGRTGAKVSATAPPAPMSALDGAARYLVTEADGEGSDLSFTAVDRKTGRIVWKRQISAVLVDKAIVGGGSLWVHGTGTVHGETIWRIDANTGRVTGILGLPEIGATALVAAGDRAWVLNPAGRLEILSGA